MRTAILFVILLATGWAAPLTAQSGTIAVNGAANVFAAGRSSTAGFAWACSGAGGLVPAQIALPPGTRRVTFPSVTGTVSCCNGSPGTNHPPDGGQGPWRFTRINSFAGIGGVRHPSRIMFLMGVFLDGSVPGGSAPSPFDVSESESMITFAPRLQASFYIGDGHASGVGGALQEFTVPCGATRLFLGFADALDFGDPSTPGQTGNPGCYSDNAGGLSCTYSLDQQGSGGTIFGSTLCPGAGGFVGTFIVSIIPPAGATPGLTVEVMGGTPNSSGLLVVSPTQGQVCSGGVCLCVSPIAGSAIPVSLDAIGRAWFRVPIPTCVVFQDYFFQFVGQSLQTPYFGTTRGIRL